MLLYLGMSEQNFIVKSTPTVKEFYSQECQQVISKTHQSGMILQHLMERNWKPSTLLSAASRNDRAKTSALQDMEQAWKESEADYFSRSCDLSEKHSQPLFFLKTSAHCEQEDLIPSSKNLTKQGMMLGGRCYGLQMWGQFIEEKGFSYLPTLGANEFRGSVRNRFPGSPTYRRSKMSEGLRNCESDPIYLHPNFAEVVMGYDSGWSELKPWAIAYVRNKRKKPLKD